MTAQQEVKRFTVHYGAAKGSDLDKHKMNAYDIGNVDCRVCQNG